MTVRDSITAARRSALTLVALLGCLLASSPAALADAVVTSRVSDPLAGTPRGARPLSATINLAVSPVPSAGTTALVFDFGQELRLGTDAAAPSCTRDVLTAGARGCPSGSQIGDGRLVLVGGSGPTLFRLAIFNEPGGRTLAVVATSPGRRPEPTILDSSVRGSQLSLALGSSLIMPPPPQAPSSISTARVRFFAAGRRADSWLHSVGCRSGAWQLSATATAPDGSTAAASSAVECQVGPPYVPTRTRGTQPALEEQRPGGCSKNVGPGTHTRGGGDKVSHAGWPGINGITWLSRRDGRHRMTGTCHNDELLGAHGSDIIHGGAGKDVIWGDEIPCCQPTSQYDRLYGDAGADWLYTSHGRNKVEGGPGNDHVWAYYGHGTIDCGTGYDTLQVRLGDTFTWHNCEVVGRFCVFGPNGHGGCLRPGEHRAGSSTRRAPTRAAPG